MPDNFFGNAPNHAMPYDSVTYNGGTVPTSAGYHLVKRGSYGSVTFSTNKCVVDFDAGCTFTNIRITADQCVLNFGPKTTLSADSSYGCLGIEGDRNYVYFGPQSTITDSGSANARDAESLQGHGIVISGSYNTVEGANWTVRATGPSGALAAYNSSGTAKHNTFKNMETRNVSNKGSYAVTADVLMSAPHTTAHNIGSWFGAPGSVNSPYSAGGYKHAWIKIGPLAGTGSPSDSNGNGYGARILYCYADLSPNNPDGSASALPTGSAGNNTMSVSNYGGSHVMMIGCYQDTGGQTGGASFSSSYATNGLIYGNVADNNTNNYSTNTSTTMVANVIKAISNSNGTQENNVEHGGNMDAFADD